MKRIFSLILILLLAAGCAEASSIKDLTIDQITPEIVEAFREGMSASLSGWSEPELYLVLMATQMEYIGRGHSVAVPQGLYVTGVDIPAGRYTVTLLEPDESAAVIIRSTTGEENVYALYDETDAATILVSVGDQIDVQVSSVRIAPYMGLGW